MITEQLLFKNQMSKAQLQLQWLNWKVDELTRKLEDIKSSTNLVHKASANLVAQDIQQLQAIGQTLEHVIELGQILDYFKT